MSFLKKIGRKGSSDGSPSSTAAHGGGRGALRTQELVDFTRGLSSEHFTLSCLSKLGLDSDVTVLAYDPVQGLLAAGLKSGSIHVYGQGGVRSVIPARSRAAGSQPSSTGTSKARPSAEIKLLDFKPGSPFLLAIDSQQTLYVWDLSLPADSPNVGTSQSSRDTKSKYAFVPRRLVAHCLRTNAMAMEVSAAYDWIFVGLEDGTTDVYDVGRMMLAPFRIPHLCPGMESSLGIRRQRPILMDIKAHPSMLNLFMFVYDSAVIVWDLKTKQVAKKFILCLPPFAPGSGSDSEDVRLARRPAFTAACWNPSGDTIAAGHENGCVSFWDVSSPNRSSGLQDRELENAGLVTVKAGFAEDVHFPRSGYRNSEGAGEREPIFKLSWSGTPEAENAAAFFAGVSSYWYGQDQQSRAPETYLTVSGGDFPTSAPALSIHTFEQKPPANASATGDQLQQKRLALRTNRTYAMLAPAPVEDFLLLPRNNPWYHGAGSFDAIVCLGIVSAPPPVEQASSNTKSIACWSFPDGTTLQSPAFDLSWTGMSDGGLPSALGCKVVDVPISTYRRLVRQMPLGYLGPANDQGYHKSSELPLAGKEFHLTGGRVHTHLKPIGMMQSATLLISWHGDGFVRFWDATAPAFCLSPVELAHCQIDTSQTSYQYLGSKLLIEDVQLATETLELAIMMFGGYITIWKFEQERDRKGMRQSPAYTSDDFDRNTQDQDDILDDILTSAYEDLSTGEGQASLPSDEPLIDLRDSLRSRGRSRDCFQPLALLNLQKGHTTAAAFSNIGFLAVSWERCALAIIDLRGPEIILLEDYAGQAGSRADRGVKDILRVTGKGDPMVGQIVVSLTWAITYHGNDSALAVRLIASTKSGVQKVFTLSNVLQQWIVESTAPTFSSDSFSDPIASFVLDSKSGAICDADSENLMRALNTEASYDGRPSSGSHLWVFVTKKGARVCADLDPSIKVVRASWDRSVLLAQLVDVMGAKVLACVRDDGKMHLLSVPSLRLIRELDLPGSRAAWIDSSSTSLSDRGKALVLEGSHATYYSLLSLANTKEVPATELYDPGRSVLPPRPGENAVTQAMSAVSYWVGANVGPMTVQDLDLIIGGADRPPPRIRPEVAAQQSVANARRTFHSKPLDPAGNPSALEREKQRILAAREAEEGQTGWSAYNPFAGMTDSVDERGEKLGFLQEKFTALETASSSMAKNAKRALLQQQAKSFLGL